MSATATLPLRLRLEAGMVLLDQPEWPTTAVFGAYFVRHADPSFLTLRYPFLTIRTTNGHAVYRVDTCEREMWTGTLVEGAVIYNQIIRDPDAADAVIAYHARRES